MRKSRLVILVSCLLALVSIQLYAQEPKGLITGKVLNEVGEPIEKAQVCLERRQGNAQFASTCFTSTDSIGEFRIENVPMDTVAVRVSKPDQGYVGFGIGAEADYYKPVSLTALAPLANVVFNLRSRGGMLGPIVADQVSGQPIFNFMVHWTVKDLDHSNFQGGGGAGFSRWTTKTAVPADTDLVITEVRARGYKTVTFPNAEQPQVPATIRLKPGETMTLRIDLPPDTGSNSNSR